MRIKPRSYLYWLRLGIAALISTLLLLYVGNTLLRLYVNEHPARISPADQALSPSAVGLEYEDIRFTATDGIALIGWYISPPGEANGATIIISHGLGGNRAQSLAYAASLAQAGYGALVFDFRAHGESGGDLSGLGWSEERDVLGALAYLKTRPDVNPERIGAVGLSLGATASLRAAAESPEIGAVWADGPGGVIAADFLPPCTLRQVITTPKWFLYYGVHQASTGLSSPESMTEVLRKLGSRPLMIVIAGQSEIETCNIPHWLERAKHAQDTWIIEDVAHIGGFGAHPEDYAARLIAFFDDALGD